MQLKKISNDHYVVVTDELITRGDWYLTDDRKILLCDKTLFGLIYAQGDWGRNPNGCKKITHSTEPLDVKITDDGIHLPDWSRVKPLSPRVVKSLVGEVDVHSVIENKFNEKKFNVDNDKFSLGMFISGYEQCLEDKKDKRFSEEDILNILYNYDNVDWSKREHKQSVIMMKEWLSEKLQSLTQPKDTWEVEFINGQLKLK